MPKAVTLRPPTFEAEQIKIPTNGKIGDAYSITFSVGVRSFPIVTTGGMLGLQVPGPDGSTYVGTQNYWIVLDVTNGTYDVLDPVAFAAKYV